VQGGGRRWEKSGEDRASSKGATPRRQRKEEISNVDLMTVKNGKILKEERKDRDRRRNNYSRQWPTRIMMVRGKNCRQERRNGTLSIIEQTGYCFETSPGTIE